MNAINSDFIISCFNNSRNKNNIDKPINNNISTGNDLLNSLNKYNLENKKEITKINKTLEEAGSDVKSINNKENFEIKTNNDQVEVNTKPDFILNLSLKNIIIVILIIIIIYLWFQLNDYKKKAKKYKKIYKQYKKSN